jgi:hypothetical protein
LVWLALVTFFAWLAWQHWAEVQGFLEQFATSLRDWIESRSAASDDDPVQAAVGLGLLPGVPPLALHLRARVGELQSHG